MRNITYNRLDNLRSTDTVKDNNTPIGELAMTYSYSIDKQVTAESFPNGSVLATTSFAAQYDPGNRVTSYTRSGGTTPPNQTWNYDDNGNWASTTLAGQTNTRSHNADNELTSGNATYDARGNMTKDPDGNEYFYDLDNRIFKIEMHQGPTVEYLYDATGRRVQSKQGSTKTAYLWWGDQECSEHKHQAGQAVIQNDLWAHPTALNTIIARAVDGSKFKMQWYHKNYLDHVYAVSDDNGDILEHYRYSASGIVEFYDPVGNTLTASQITNPVLWNSRRYDEFTKLHYYKYRHYNPKLGRWTSRDPIEEEGGVNLYKFVENNGLNNIDLFGNKPLLEMNAYPKEYKYCGGATWIVQFRGRNLTHNYGLVAQQMKITIKFEKCPNADKKPDDIYYEYTEFWPYIGGYWHVNGVDTWEVQEKSLRDRYGCTKGTVTFNGTARLIDGGRQLDYKTNESHPSGGLPYVDNHVWPDGDASNTIKRNWKLKWDCCEKGSRNPTEEVGSEKCLFAIFILLFVVLTIFWHNRTCNITNTNEVTKF
jgi:RHS repeat-associated protein